MLTAPVPDPQDIDLGATWTYLGWPWGLSNGYNRAVFVAKQQLAQHENGGDGGLGGKIHMMMMCVS